MSDEWISARNYETIEDLPFTDDQKKLALVWMAGVLFDKLGVERLGLDGHSKSYDPLSFSPDGRVHTYVFDLHDGGRHHSFTGYADLERRIIQEMAEKIEDHLRDRP